MKTQQPNFENVKTLFYQTFVNCDKATTCILWQDLKSMSRKHSFNEKTRQFKADFNKWLDNIDIRQVGALIDECIKVNAKMPNWMKSKRYFIDYNQYGVLDIIPIKD